MSKTEPSMQEINDLLFEEETDRVNEDGTGTDSAQPKSEPRLLKQKGLSAELENLAPVPASKRPLVQAGIMAVIAIPLGWGLISAFSGGGTTPPESEHQSASLSDGTIVDRQKANNQDQAEQINKLEVENGLLKQKLEVIPVKPKQSAVPQTQPPTQASPTSTPARPTATPTTRQAYVPPPRRVSTPATPRTVRRPVYYAKAPGLISQRTTRTSGATKSAAIAQMVAKAKPQPKVDPMKQWLDAANRGHYIASSGGTLSADASGGAIAQPAAYTESTQPTPNLPSTGNTASSQSSATDAIPTYEPLTAQQGPPTTLAQSGPSPAAGPTAAPPQAAPPPGDPNRRLDIGSAVNAVLESAVAWTPDGPEQSLSYRLKLKEGFKNQSGQEVLPKGTDLIAQVTEKTNSGLFFMEVTHVLSGANRHRVQVPNGALQVVAEDGSPLQAKLKKKGGRNFLADAAAIFAPGLERAMGSIADSSDSLILEDGDRSLIRTSGSDSNPLAAGISGVAEGVGQKFSVQNNRPTQTSTPYFKLSEGETVQILVNQDVQL